MIYILLASALELSTIIASLCIYENKFNSVIKEILKRECRIKEHDSKEATRLIKENINKNDIDFKIRNLILPVFNIIYTHHHKRQCVESCMNEISKNNLLVKQTGIEKIELWKLKNNYDIAHWTLHEEAYPALEIKESFKEPVFIRKCEVKYDSFPGKYDINEVKLLAEAYGYGYRIGLIDDEAVAVIGVYDTDLNFNFLKIPEESDYKEFKKVVKQDYPKYTYKIYQYTLPHNIEVFKHSFQKIHDARSIIEEENNSHKKENNEKVFQKKLN